MDEYRDSAPPADWMHQSAATLDGVGPQCAALLERLGLRTVADVLFFFPRDYADLSEICPIGRLDEVAGHRRAVSICGTIEEVELRTLGGGRSILGAVISDGEAAMRAVWFNQPFMQQRLVRGSRVMLSGAPRLHGLRWEMSHPRVRQLQEDEQPVAGEILPLYHLTEGLGQGQIRRIVANVVRQWADQVVDALPESYRAVHDLCPLSQALREIHRPPNAARLRAARRRFVYQELLTLQLALALRRWNIQHRRPAPPLPATAKINARIRRLFAFELTADQETVIGEIAADMARDVPMNRLLQGEVGSGKTVVAEYAMLLTVAQSHQAVLMAPTEVLANQHLRTLQRDLAQSRVRMALLTGAVTGSRRQQLLQSVAHGEVDLLIGTQALLHEDIAFPRLGLVVIDEQHKFGVRQRALLKQAAAQPHYLVMTATPIPRTVAMTLFGDLDVSTLRTGPPGRQPVHTYLGTESQRGQWWEFFGRKLREGRQGYVIAPRVDDDDPQQAVGVEQLLEHLTNGPLAAFRVDLIHGRMSTAEKEAAMESFRRGRTQVLVATSVIEVGVDVPNATLMTIEGADRFGLAQLHQLRGRIRRGAFPGYVCVFAQPSTDDAQCRLEAFVQTSDGFELAELDFATRGPGDLFGTVQHGLPPLRIADLRTDLDVLEEARRDAQQLTAGGAPQLFLPEFTPLRRRVLRRYGHALDLADVG